MKTKNTKNKIDIDCESMARIEAIAKKNGVSVESVLNRALLNLAASVIGNQIRDAS